MIKNGGSDGYSMKIVFLDDELQKFLLKLDKSTVAKVLRTLDLLARFGNQLGMPHAKKVDRRLFELRIRGVQEVRIFYTFFNNDIVLLYGFVKKSQQISLKDLRAGRKKLASLDII